MKKTIINLFMIATLLTPFALTSCDDDDNSASKPSPQVDNELSGSVKDTRTLDATVEYLLTGPLLVEDGGTLNIPAGTVIKAEKGFNSYILVLQGGKINAKGTAERPITITADIPNAKQGHWGGLIINGKAPLSGGTTGSTEINSSFIYGGNVVNDNSGELTYLKLEYTGARSSADVEHNGLTLNGVGSGTKIENIYIPNGSDDGIEFFGGSVNVTNLLIVNSDDDMFDFTQGYTGKLENAYGIWEAGFVSSEKDPRGIEADGNLDGEFPDQSNQSNFVVKNMTIELKLDASDDAFKHMHDVIKLRRGATATITNALVKGVGQTKDLIDLTDGAGNAQTTASISLTNSLTNAIIGKDINNATGVEYPNVKLETGNTGCPTSIFTWTDYNF